jgi:hypothetical protein
LRLRQQRIDALGELSLSIAFHSVILPCRWHRRGATRSCVSVARVERGSAP